MTFSSCIFRTRDLLAGLYLNSASYRNLDEIAETLCRSRSKSQTLMVIGQVSVPDAEARWTSGDIWSLHLLFEDNFWSCDVAEVNYSPFWARVPVGRIRNISRILSRTFREPFADVLRSKNTVLETISFWCQAGRAFIICSANRVPLKISEHGTIRNWQPVHHQASNTNT